MNSGLKTIIPASGISGMLCLLAGIMAGIMANTAQAEEMSIIDIYRAQGGLANSEPGAGEQDTFGESVGAVTDPLPTGHEMPPEKVEGFRAAIEQVFPMNPEMIKRYREITRKIEQAIQEKPEPREKTSVNLISLEPGERAPLINVSPSIASVIGFYDLTGAPWPVTQYLLGDNQKFQAAHLGENPDEKSHNLVLTAGARIGFTNLVVALEGHDKPVSIRININENVVDFQFDIQVMHPGPAARINSATPELTETVTEAGDSLLLAAMSGVDLPADARKVEVIGVDARGWLVGNDLYLRSPNALLSPRSTGAMSGPGGMRVYRVAPVHMALFSVNGQYVRADIKLP